MSTRINRKAIARNRATMKKVVSKVKGAIKKYR